MFGLSGWRPEDVADPYPVYRRYRERDPVQRGEGGAWYVFGFDDVAAVLTGADFGRGPGGPVTRRTPALYRVVSNWLVFMDPPRHTRLRGLLAAEFTPAVVRRLRPRIAEIAAELVAGLRDRPVIDLVADFAAPYPIMVIGELLGVPAERRDWFRRRALWLQEAGSARAAGGGEPRVDLAERAARELAEYFSRQAERRRRDPRDDLLSLLVSAAGRGAPLGADEIVGTCVHLLTAGHETTTHLIGKSVLALLRAPAVLDRLRGGDVPWPAAVEELIRYDPPVQMVSRWARCDRVLGGRRVRAGEKVVAVIGSANRDPRRFDAPDELRLDRAPARHAGFGLGIHYCLGATLARAEAEIGLATLLAAFPRLALTGEPVPYGDDMVFHGPARLPLRTGSATPSPMIKEENACQNP